VIGGRVLDATAVHDLTIARTVYAAAFLAAANDEIEHSSMPSDLRRC
jgi:hypothetical protein